MAIEIKTYSQMLEVLSEGYDSLGKKIDIDQYDKKSIKTLKNLSDEIAQKEVVLVVKEFAGYKRVARAALSAGVVLTVGRKWQFQEVERRYPEKNISVGKKKSTTITETRGRDEMDFEAALRGLEEELGIRATREQLDIYTHLLFGWNGRDEHGGYESTVYYGLRSYTQVQKFGLVLQELPWEEEVREFDDKGVFNTIQRFPFSETLPDPPQHEETTFFDRAGVPRKLPTERS